MKREEILGEIQALRAELERVETREQARGVARRIRALGKEAHTARTLGDLVGIASFLGVVDRFVEEARATIVDIYGTSGWDEPETLDQAMARRVPLPAAPGTSEPPTLTDEDLELFVRRWKEHDEEPDAVPRLAAEVRRLRSDEWLQAAAGEIATASFGVDRAVVKAAALEILRKHRDGKP